MASSMIVVWDGVIAVDARDFLDEVSPPDDAFTDIHAVIGGAR